MAKAPKPTLLQRYPWLLFVSIAITVVYALFLFLEMASYKQASVLHHVSLDQIAQDHPTSGWYEVKGGVPNYVFAEAVGFENDHDKDAGHDYNSFVPYIDPSTKNVVMLVEQQGYSPKDFTLLIDQGKPQNVMGVFFDPGKVDPKLWPMFDARNYHIDQNIPVLLANDAPDPGALKTKLIVAAIVALFFGSTPWGVMYFVSRPKKRRKKFSERYPERRVY